MGFETKRVVAGSLLSASLVVGGGWLTNEGFSNMERAGHVELCQAPPEALEQKCADVITMTDTAVKSEVILTNVEAWGGVTAAALGVLGLVGTLGAAIGRENLWGK